jgi:hypothetical protein
MKTGQKITSVMRLKPGDLLAIPLGSDLFAFARVYRSARLGLFSLRAPKMADPEDLLKSMPEFFCGFFCTSKQKAELDWILIGRFPFQSDAEGIPPSSFSRDIVNPDWYTVFEGSKSRSIRKKDFDPTGLSPAVLHSPKSLRSRLLHGYSDPMHNHFTNADSNKENGA